MTGTSQSFQCCHLKSNADCELLLGLQKQTNKQAKKSSFNDSIQSMPLKNSKLSSHEGGITKKGISGTENIFLLDMTTNSRCATVQEDDLDNLFFTFFKAVPLDPYSIAQQ